MTEAQKKLMEKLNLNEKLFQKSDLSLEEKVTILENAVLDMADYMFGEEE